MKRSQRFVFGLGTGRCGTVSLYRLLDAQEGVRVRHETRPFLPWDVCWDMMHKRLERWAKRDPQICGEVACFLLPYVRGIAHAAEGRARFVCLRREKQAFIDSMRHKMRPRPESRWNPLAPTQELACATCRSESLWYNSFPHYQGDLAASLSRYYDEYYAEAERLEREMPGVFRILLMKALNTEAGVREILDLAGIPEPSRRVIVGIRENASA